jgi:hypothetical protein
MRILNATGLPAGLVRAIANDPYDSEGADITASTLSDPPLLQALKRKHEAELEEDAADRIWALFGQAVHVIVDRASQKTEGVLSEQRLSMDVAGWKVSGAYDHLNIENGVLSDWKCTSAWTIVFGDRLKSWEQQTNVLAHLLELSGRAVSAIEVIAILRDWSQKDVERSLKGDYPKAPVQIVPLKLWSSDKRQAYIEERVRLHQNARDLLAKGHADLITPCTPEERWEKKDRKTGTSTYARCGSEEKRGYCPVAKFCPVLEAEKEFVP